MEETPTYKKLVEENGDIFAPKFITFLFYVTAFVHSFLWWWLTIPRMTLVWIQTRLIIWAANRILKIASQNDPKRSEKLAKYMKFIKAVSSKDGQEEEEKKDVV